MAEVYEHLVVEVYAAAAGVWRLAKALDDYSQDGWELVTADNSLLYLRRPL